MAKKTNNISPVSPSEVYAGGTLTPISATDLKDNEVAINQLLNDHNILQKEIAKERERNQELERELAGAKLSPLMSIMAAILNVVSVILIGIGTSQLSNMTTWLPLTLIILGGLCLLNANIATIFYKPLSKWLTK